MNSNGFSGTTLYEYLEIGSDVILWNYLSPSYDE